MLHAEAFFSAHYGSSEALLRDTAGQGGNHGMSILSAIWFGENYARATHTSSLVETQLPRLLQLLPPCGSAIY